MKINGSDIRRLVVVLVVTVVSVGWGRAGAQAVPQPMSPRRAVNDYVHLFSGVQRQALEELANRLAGDDLGRVTIVTVNGWGDCSGAEYAAAILEQWPVGDSGRWNGVVILVGGLERGEEPEAFAAVGEGWGSGRSSEQVRRMVDREMNRYLKGGEPDWYRAVEAGLTTIDAIGRGEYEPQATEGGGAGTAVVFGRLEIALAGIAILLIFIILRRSYRNPERGRLKGLFWPLSGIRRRRYLKPKN